MSGVQCTRGRRSWQFYFASLDQFIKIYQSWSLFRRWFITGSEYNCYCHMLWVEKMITLAIYACLSNTYKNLTSDKWVVETFVFSIKFPDIIWNPQIGADTSVELHQNNQALEMQRFIERTKSSGWHLYSSYKFYCVLLCQSVLEKGLSVWCIRSLWGRSSLKHVDTITFIETLKNNRTMRTMSLNLTEKKHW